MILPRNYLLRLACAVALGTALAAPASAAVLVLRASSDAVSKRYPVGAILEKGEVRLRRGEHLFIVENGKLSKLAGPTRIAVDVVRPGERSILQRIADALKQVEERREVLAASRGPATPGSAPPNIWVVDVTRDGTFCVADPLHLKLWRPDGSRWTEAVIKDLATGKQHTITWSAGESLTAWPSDLQVRHEATYWYNDGSRRSRRLTLLKMKKQGAYVSLLPALAQKGCDYQFDWAAWGTSITAYNRTPR